MRKKLLIIVLCFLSLEVNADMLDVKLSGGVWTTDYSGSIRDSFNILDTINLKSVLGLKSSSQSFYSVSVEHFIPFVPNIRFGQSNLNTTGSNTLLFAFTYNGVIYSTNEAITSELNLDHSEVTAYWNLVDKIIKFDAGITIKDFSGGVSIMNEIVGTVSYKVKETIPLVYAGLEAKIPQSGISFGANGSYISNGKKSLSDVMAFVRYSSKYNVGIEAGYRILTFNNNETPFFAEIEAAGTYLNGTIYF